MFNEALLTVSLLVLPTKAPLTVVEVPYRNLETCSITAKEVSVKVNKHLKNFEMNYKVECTRVGYSL